MKLRLLALSAVFFTLTYAAPGSLANDQGRRSSQEPACLR